MRTKDSEALCDVEEALEAAAVRMARVVCESGAPDDLRKFVQKQWLRLAKIQASIEEYRERPTDTPGVGSKEEP